MGQQSALLSTLDDALVCFRRLERERNEAFTQLKALEQDVGILRALLPRSRAHAMNVLAKSPRPAGNSAALDVDGLYNNGYRDRALRWAAGRLTQEPDAEVRRWTTLALGLVGDTKTVPALAVALEDADTGVRKEAAVALGRIGTARVVAPLSGALKEADKGVRREVVKALGRTGKPAIRELISGLRDPDPSVCRASSDALVEMGSLAIRPLAKVILHEDDRQARIGAVETLGRMGGGGAVAPLLVVLMESDAGMQEAAATALVRTGRPAVGPLVRLMRMADDPLRRRAAEVLVRMRGLAVKPLIGALADGTNVRVTTSEALVRIGRPSVRPLMKALNDANPAVRLEAAMALGLIGDPGAVGSLVKMMKAKDRRLRRRAAEALVRLGSPAAGPLVCLLKEADAGVRGEAAWALAQIGRPAFKPLCQALQDADVGARWEAAQVLSRLRNGGHLRGLHGGWEWIVDETLLLAWFKSGWAQDRAGKHGPGDSRRQSTVSPPVRRWPASQKRKADHPRSLP